MGSLDLGENRVFCRGWVGGKRGGNGEHACDVIYVCTVDQTDRCHGYGERVEHMSRRGPDLLPTLSPNAIPLLEAAGSACSIE